VQAYIYIYGLHLALAQITIIQKVWFFFEKNSTFTSEFVDKGKTQTDKQDTLNKPQIILHKTETATYLTTIQINEKLYRSTQ
jgi:hypothetical protein